MATDNERQAARKALTDSLGFVRASAAPLVMEKDREACKKAMLEAAEKFVKRRKKAEAKATK